MLSLFPQVLFLAPGGTALIRLAAAITFLAMAYWHTRHSKHLSRAHFPVIGSGSWIVWLSVVVEAGVGGLLVVGLFTQVVALVGAVLALKSFIWTKRLPDFFPLDRTASLLLLVICLCLLVSGAGAFAFDLPL